MSEIQKIFGYWRIMAQSAFGKVRKIPVTKKLSPTGVLERIGQILAKNFGNVEMLIKYFSKK